jgi:hypothetical protein
MSDYSLEDQLAYMMGMLIDHYVECDNLSRSWARRKVMKMSVKEISDNFRTYCYSNG